MDAWKALHHYLRLRRNVRDAWHVLQRYRVSSDDVDVVLRNGAHLTLRRACQDVTIFHRIFVQDEYRLERYERRIKGDVVDLGANVGLFACRIAGRAARVICYEPITPNFAQLQRNTAALSNVTNVHAAVSGTAKTIRIHYPTDANFSGGFSQYPHPHLHHTDTYEDVPAVTLEMIFSRHDIQHCSMLKIDVEGAEYDILYQTPAAVLSCIERISGEYHHINGGDASRRIGALAAFLNKHGFDVEAMPKRRLANHGLFFAHRANRPAGGVTRYTGPGAARHLASTGGNAAA